MHISILPTSRVYSELHATTIINKVCMCTHTHNSDITDMMALLQLSLTVLCLAVTAIVSTVHCYHEGKPYLMYII